MWIKVSNPLGKGFLYVELDWFGTVAIHPFYYPRGVRLLSLESIVYGPKDRKMRLGSNRITLANGLLTKLHLREIWQKYTHKLDRIRGTIYKKTFTIR